jgi:hypothetical protein
MDMNLDLPQLQHADNWANRFNCPFIQIYLLKALIFEL